MTNTNVEFKRLGSGHVLESEAASDMAARLACAVTARGQAGLLVSGGHPPVVWAP